MNLKAEFGNIDIYLFDQLLKGRFEHCQRILEVGCGTGRNLTYFLKRDFEVHGVDKNPEAIRGVQKLAQQLNASNDGQNFVVAAIENLPYEAAFLMP